MCHHDGHWGWCFWCGKPATHITKINRLYICKEHAQMALINGQELDENPDYMEENNETSEEIKKQ